MIKRILYFFGFFLMIVSSCTSNNTLTEGQQLFKIQVIIDFGGCKPIKEVNIETPRQLTALEALQYASVVETHPVGEHVFVSAIDSIQAVRGGMAWYYKVNGESPGVLAINNKIENGDTLYWIYKKDVCSIKVDKN